MRDMPTTQLRIVPEIERDAFSGLLAKDIADKVVGYLVKMEIIDSRQAKDIYPNIASRAQHEMEKRRK